MVQDNRLQSRDLAQSRVQGVAHNHPWQVSGRAVTALHHIFLLVLLGLFLSACSGSMVQTRGAYVAPDRSMARVSAPTGERMIDTADRLFAAGQVAAAIPMYRSSMGSDPTRARLGLAKALVAEGRPQGAYNLTEDCLTGTCSSELLVVRGEAALALGRYDDARSIFQRAVDTIPSARGYAGLGIAMALTGSFSEAIAVFEKLPAPTGPSNKALVLIAMGRANEGRLILEQMVRDGTAGLKERQNLALAYILLGDDDRARTFAQLDLDLQSALQTLAFYRQLAALNASDRLKALVTGSIDPSWTRRDAGNFMPRPQETAAAASVRLLASNEETVVTVVDATPLPEPEPEPVVEPEPEPKPLSGRPDVVPADAPPILEAEGWAVQIAAYRRIRELMTGWDILRENNLDILETIPPRRSEVDFGPDGRIEGGPTGFYYRLNAGPLETLGEAQQLCKTLILRGTDCWVRPPEVSEGRLPD